MSMMVSASGRLGRLRFGRLGRLLLVDLFLVGLDVRFGVAVGVGFYVPRFGIAGLSLVRLWFTRFGFVRLALFLSRFLFAGVVALGLGAALALGRRPRLDRLQVVGDGGRRLRARRVVLLQEALDPEQAAAFGQSARAFVAKRAILRKKLGAGLARIQVFLGGGAPRRQHQTSECQAEYTANSSFFLRSHGFLRPHVRPGPLDSLFLSTCDPRQIACGTRPAGIAAKAEL